MSDKYYSSEEVLKRMHAQIRRFDKKLKDFRIAVLAGGAGVEREISLESGNCVYSALKDGGLNVDLIVIDKDVSSILRKKWDRFDVIFNVMHGEFGEDGSVQGMFNLLDVPVVGSKILGSAVAMDKSVSKLLFALLGIPTPKWLFVPYLEGVRPDDVVKNWEGAAVIKPMRSGSSIGVTFCGDVGELLRKLPGLVKTYKGVIVEKPVEKLKEVTCTIIDSFNPIALPPIGITPLSREFFDFSAKYTKGETEYQVPARITGGQFEKISEFSIRFFRAVKLSSYARFDIIIDTAGKLQFLECNTLPGLTKRSLVPMSASAFGLEYLDLLKFLIFDTIRLKAYI